MKFETFLKNNSNKKYVYKKVISVGKICTVEGNYCPLKNTDYKSIELYDHECQNKIIKHQFEIDENVQFKSQFPKHLKYSQVCMSRTPYHSEFLVTVLKKITLSSFRLKSLIYYNTDAHLSEADTLVETLMQINLQRSIPQTVVAIFLDNSSTELLFNILSIFFRRLEYPLFFATSEFVNLIINYQSNTNLNNLNYNIFDKNSEFNNVLDRALQRCSLFQIANLSLLIEYCQMWIRLEIKKEVELDKFICSKNIYEDSSYILSKVFGPFVIGLPNSVIMYKFMTKSSFDLIEIRQIIFYNLLKSESFNFWHLWSINAMCKKYC